MFKSAYAGLFSFAATHPFIASLACASLLTLLALVYKARKIDRSHRRLIEEKLAEAEHFNSWIGGDAYVRSFPQENDDAMERKPF